MCKSKFFILILLLLNAFTQPCLAQNKLIHGKVLDNSTSKPIPGTIVKIEHSSNISKTDKKGEYALEVSTSLCKIKFEEFVDKKIARIEKLSDDEINIYLSDLSNQEIFKLSLQELLNVKIDIASKSLESENLASGVVSVVSAQEIESFGATSLRDVLERVTSIVGLTGYSLRNVISMRGDQIAPGSGHLLLMINGRPTRNGLVEDDDAVDIFSMFPLSNIKQIEIIRGPGSVLYGSGAYTGVINIVTKTEDEYFSISADGASPQGFLAAVSGSKVLKKGMLSGGLFYKNLQDWNQSLTLETGIDTAFNTSEKGLGMNLTYHLNRLTVNTALFLNEDFNIAPRFGGNYLLRNKHFIDVAYSIPFTKKLETTIHATNTHAYKDGYPLHPKSAANDFITELTTKYKPNNKTNIVVGGLLNYISGSTYRLVDDDEKSVIPYYELTRYSLYGQINYQLFNSFNIIGGFQAYQFQTNLTPKLIPRIGIVYEPLHGVILKALYAQAFRGPSAIETTVKSETLVGNPNLKPESVNSYDFQIIYNKTKFNGSLSLFLNKQYDIIRRYPKGRRQGYENAGQFAAKGVEMEMKYIPNSKLFITGSASYQTNVLNDSIENSTTSPITAKLGVSYNTDWGLSLGVFNIYNSKPPDVILTSPNRMIVNPIPQAFNLLSANINYNLSNLLQLSKTQLFLNLRVDNLLDESIYNAEWNRSIINSIPGKPGRRVYLGLKFKL